MSSFLLLNGLCVQMATSNALDYEICDRRGATECEKEAKNAATDL